MVFMKYKRLVLIVVAVLASFAALNYAVWKIWTQDLITDIHYSGGDLTRMGYILGSKLYRTNKVNLPRRHISLQEYRGQQVDVVTIGDSFSQGGGGGENRFYQDYIASIHKLSVINLTHYHDLDFISTISLFLNNGFLERMRPRFVLICATERNLKSMAQQIDFQRVVPIDTVMAFKEYPYRSHPSKVPFINSGNIKLPLNALWYSRTDHGLFGNVQLTDLTMDCFTVKNSRKLLYLPYEQGVDIADVQQLNENLNKLAERLGRKGIQLVYMPYVDKYTLYSKWLTRRKYPESQFFELLRPLPKRYHFVDTKALLREEVEQGGKDIFYPDDTHSSWKASKKIFENVKIFDR